MGTSAEYKIQHYNDSLGGMAAYQLERLACNMYISSFNDIVVTNRNKVQYNLQ